MAGTNALVSPITTQDAPNSSRLRFAGVPMMRRHGEARFLQSLVDFIRDQNRPVMPARAAKRDREVAFSFPYVMR